jgi:hypothetical protein
MHQNLEASTKPWAKHAQGLIRAAGRQSNTPTAGAPLVGCVLETSAWGKPLGLDGLAQAKPVGAVMGLTPNMFRPPRGQLPMQ